MLCKLVSVPEHVSLQLLPRHGCLLLEAEVLHYGGLWLILGAVVLLQVGVLQGILKWT